MLSLESIHQMRHLTIFLSIALSGDAGATTFGLYTYEINSDNASVTITDYDISGTGALVIVDTLGEVPRHQHRVSLILAMHWPDERHHSGQRHQHRGCLILAMPGA